MASLAVTKQCRTKIAFLQEPDEYIRDCVERLVDAELVRKGITIPPQSDGA